MKSYTENFDATTKHRLMVTPDSVTISFGRESTENEQSDVRSFFNEVIHDLLDTTVTLRGGMSLNYRTIQMVSRSGNLKVNYNVRTNCKGAYDAPRKF